MKFTFLTLSCLLMGLISYAQQKKVDSLNRLIQSATSDTQRINLINEKIDFWISSNLDSAIALARINIASARRLGYAKGEAYALLSLSTSVNFKGDYDTAAAVLIRAERIFNSLKDSAGLSKAYSGYGMMYGMQSQYDRSISYYEKAIALAQRLNDKQYLGNCYQNIAINYMMQSNFSRALSYQQKALSIHNELNNENGIAYVTLNMGITYKSMEDNSKAKLFFLRAAEIARKIHLVNVELYAYSNLASTYEKLHDNDSSYIYSMKSVALAKQMGDIGMSASGLSAAATARANGNKYEEAEKLGKEAMEVADSSKQPLNIFQAYSAMGFILKKQEFYQKAIPFYEKAFSFLKKSDIYDVQIGKFYDQLSQCYEKTGNYAKALSNYKLFAEITDSARSKDNIRKATELSMNYDFEKKQEVQRTGQKLKDDMAHSKQVALIAALAIFLLLALAAFAGFKNKQKANALLKKQKKEIESTLGQLRSTQAQLVQSEKMASLGELTAGIAHEIQNPLNFVNNFSDINKELLQELKEEADKGNITEVKTIADDVIGNEEKINHHGKRADAIVKGMLQHSRSSTGRKEPTDVNSLCDEYLRLSYHGLRAKDKNFNAALKTEFDDSIQKINIIPQDIGRVLLNLYNNAFYACKERRDALYASHALAASHNENEYEPTVSISTKRIADIVEIKVSDNGNGIPNTIVDKIFQPFFTTKPTGEGTGLGLSLSYDIVKAHGGELKVENKVDEGNPDKFGKGTTFIIQLPVV